MATPVYNDSGLPGFPRPTTRAASGPLGYQSGQKITSRRRKGKGPGGPRRPKPVAQTPQAPPVPQYGPSMQRAMADRELVYGDAILRAQAQQRNAGTYFDAYLSEVAKQQAAAKARYDAAAGMVPGLAPTVGPAVQTAEGAQAADSRGIVNQQFGNLLTAQGAATQDYFGGRAVVGAAQKASSQIQAGAEVGRLEKEGDAYQVQQRGKYRDERHRQRLEDKAFGLDVAKANADVQSAAADRRQENRQNRQDRRDQRRKDRLDAQAEGRDVITSGPFAGMTHDEVRGLSPEEKTKLRNQGGAGAKGTVTPTQRRSNRITLRRIIKKVQDNDAGNPGYLKAAIQGLTNANVDPVLARAGARAALGKPIPPALAHRLLRDYGIRVKTRKGYVRPRPLAQKGHGSEGGQMLGPAQLGEDEG